MSFLRIFLCLFLSSICGFVTGQMCQEEFHNNQPPPQTDVVRISRADVTHSAVSSIMGVVRFVSSNSDTSSFQNRDVSLWVKHLKKYYKESLAILPFHSWYSRPHAMASKFSELRNDDLVFKKDGSWLQGQGLTGEQKKERIRKLKQITRLYREGHLHQLSSALEDSRRSNFTAFFKVLVFSHAVRIPAELLKELVLEQLNPENNHLAFYKRYYDKIFPSPKRASLREWMSLTYDVVQAMDPLLLKSMIMQDLFMWLRLHTEESLWRQLSHIHSGSIN